MVSIYDIYMALAGVCASVFSLALNLTASNLISVDDIVL